MEERYGYCECGCGQKTTIAVQDHPRFGWVKGEPMRFVRGHNNRGRHPRLGAQPYVVEDCGYATKCWIWKGFIHKSGYGSAAKDGKYIRAHRLFYERHVGPIPLKMVVDHLCRVKACVNPEHLEVVSNAVNTRRGTSTRLTEDDVREIKRRLAVGKQGIGRQLANEFGVSPVTISNIKHGLKWADVA